MVRSYSHKYRLFTNDLIYSELQKEKKPKKHWETNISLLQNKVWENLAVDLNFNVRFYSLSGDIDCFWCLKKVFVGK